MPTKYTPQRKIVWLASDGSEWEVEADARAHSEGVALTQGLASFIYDFSPLGKDESEELACMLIRTYIFTRKESPDAQAPTD